MHRTATHTLEPEHHDHGSETAVLRRNNPLDNCSPASPRLHCEHPLEEEGSRDGSHTHERHPPLDRLSWLPAELLVDICSKLSAKELCRARTLSSTFRTLIDVNERAITRRMVLFHQTRLRTDHDTLANTGGLSFDEVYRRILHHYGVPQDSSARRDILTRLVFQHGKRRYERLGDAMKHPIRTLMGAATMTFDAAVPHVHDGRRCHVCPKGIRYGKFWILTQADTERIESLGVMLGVPGLHEEGCLRYCVGNQQMLDLVLQICKRPKVEVTALERAAVLESMFVW